MYAVLVIKSGPLCVENGCPQRSPREEGIKYGSCGDLRENISVLSEFSYSPQRAVTTRPTLLATNAPPGAGDQRDFTTQLIFS